MRAVLTTGLFGMLLLPTVVHAGEPLRVGAVAYAPGAVTVFEGVRKHCARQGLAIDYVLYSNYDALVKALRDGQVDVAWNTPLAHARFCLAADGKCQTLVMRDVDLGFRAVLVARKESGVTKPADLKAGKTLVVGSKEAAEATVLPFFYLAREGVRAGDVKQLRLDDELDLSGNPCSSEQHVLAALRKGRGDAGFVSERLWKTLARAGSPEADGLMAVYTTPAFSHCVFTARADLDAKRADAFRAAMLKMTPSDPTGAEVLRLEGAGKWVAGEADGFADLLEALKAAK
jgi:ABC-type phosphate/phosphonate transport system substrate-binding protein